jgi:hypothetical protein
MKHHIKIFSLFCLAAAAWILSGCGNMYLINYSNIKADLNYSGSRSVSVGVLDQRPYILSGENDPKYVGTMRGGYGNPFDLWTQSNLNLVDDMAATLAETLRSKGFNVLTVKAAVGKEASGILSEMKSSGADRLVYMEVKDWWSNYYPESFGAEKTELIMNVVLKVMDKNQRVLGSNSLKEIAVPPSGWPKDTIPGLYQKKMTELLNDKGIQRALK